MPVMPQWDCRREKSCLLKAGIDDVRVGFTVAGRQDWRSTAGESLNHLIRWRVEHDASLTYTCQPKLVELLIL